MPDWLLSPLLTALGFALGFFYTRTMRLAETLPAKYVAKDDCMAIRQECLHFRDNGRDEVLQRLERLETKMDRLSERFTVKP